MKFNMHSLKNSRTSRFFARISKQCKVILSTGKELDFHKGNGCGSCTYEGKMTKREEREYVQAMKLIGC